MNGTDYADRLARADVAVSTADRSVRDAVQRLGSEATPRLAQIGVAAVAVGAVAALVLRRARRSNSRVAKAIDYSVLLPLAANLIPRAIAMFSKQSPTRSARVGAPPRRGPGTSGSSRPVRTP